MPHATIPDQPCAAWFRLSWRDRILGAALVPLFGRDNALTIKPADLPAYVATKLAVDGKDRPNLTQALRRIYAARLIVQDGPKLRLLYSNAALKKYGRQPSGSERRSDAAMSPDGVNGAKSNGSYWSSQAQKRQLNAPDYSSASELSEDVLRAVQSIGRERGVLPTPPVAARILERTLPRIQQVIDSGRYPTRSLAINAYVRAAYKEWSPATQPFAFALADVVLDLSAHLPRPEETLV